MNPVRFGWTLQLPMSSQPQMNDFLRQVKTELSVMKPQDYGKQDGQDFSLDVVRTPSTANLSTLVLKRRNGTHVWTGDRTTLSQSAATVARLVVAQIQQVLPQRIK